MSISKEKRTKEQAMRLLDRAIEQEEALLEKVNALETELAECRKKAANPRHELEEQALPKSKVSFRLDYYRTEEKGSLKGIIEHLPTRESRPFEGAQFGEIKDFITQFVGAGIWPPEVSVRPSVLKTPPSFPPEIIENTVEAEKKERSPLLRKLFPEIFGNPAPAPSSSVPTEPATIPAQLEAEPFLVLTEGKAENQRGIKMGQPIQIGIRMKELADFWGKPCSLRLSAKSLEKKPSKTLETEEHCTPDQDLLRVPVRNLPLQQGVYRLEVSMALCDEPDKGYYQDDRLLVVQ